MEIRAPKDGYISGILVQEAVHVQAGAAVAQMDDVEEKLKLARVANLEQLRTIVAKRLTSPAIDTTRRLAQIAIELAKLDEHIANEGKALADVGAQLGTRSLQDASVQHDVCSKAALATETAGKQLTMLEYVVNEATSVNTLVAMHLQNEIAAATALVDSMTLRALSDGSVHVRVPKGGFVRKGDIVFEVK
jgi:multidrug efflux pump subunit AcrA (membrane-fusion protein)